MIGFALGAIFWIGTVGGIASRDQAITQAGYLPWLLAAGVLLMGGGILSLLLPTTVTGIAIASTLGAIVGLVVAVFTGQPWMILPMLTVAIAGAVLAVGAQTVMSGRTA